MEFLEYLRESHNIILNTQQEIAVNTIEGATLLLAVPGSGKTTVIITRMGNMIYNYRILPENILNITFSKASAKDMKTRFIRIFGNELENRIEFRTIHSLCLMVLKHYYKNENINEPKLLEDNFARIKKIYIDLNKSYVGDEIIKDIIQKISFSTNMLLNIEEIKKIEVAGCDFQEIYKQYNEFKASSNQMDFDDMLYFVYEIFRNNPNYLSYYQEQFKFINLDEAQDTSFLQHEIIRLLAQKYGNIFMVGDEDQSIYGFRAAFPKALLNFEKIFNNAKVLKMERNYRSTKNIVESANRFIKQNKERFDKNMFCENDEGLQIKHIQLNDSREQYSYIVNYIKKEHSKKSIAVLYRNNDSAVPLVDAFDREGIKFSIRENTPTFFTHFVTNEILSFIRLAYDLSDVSAFEKIYYRLNINLSKVMLEFVKQKPKGDVFETLLKYPGIDISMMKNIDKRQSEFKNLNKLSPLEAINYVEHKLGYSITLVNITKQGFSLETLLQKLNVLKNIALKNEDHLSFLNRVSKLRDIMGNVGINNSQVTLSTVHSSKGLEFDVVIIIDAIDGQFPTSESVRQRNEMNDSSLYEEETRLFYVGITRARKELMTISSNQSYDQTIRISRFIDDLQNKPRIEKQENINQIHTKTLYNTNRFSSIKELKDYKVGSNISHKTFGKGVIINLSGTTAEVKFHNKNTLKLDLKRCIENNIINVL